MNNCLYCGNPVNNKYCNSSCQLNYEYANGIRDKNKITKKAREKSNRMFKQFNWLNTKESRAKLNKVMQTSEYKEKSRECKLGSNNPMYGKKSWNYTGISKRDKYGNADRGFNWKTIRKAIKIRDNYTCQECGITEADTKQYLQVHHLVKYSIFKENSADNLITLCPKCHARYESQFIKVSGIRKIQKETDVYNLSVEDDESYVANSFAVHNCRSTVAFKVDIKIKEKVN